MTIKLAPYGSLLNEKPRNPEKNRVKPDSESQNDPET